VQTAGLAARVPHLNGGLVSLLENPPAAAYGHRVEPQRFACPTCSRSLTPTPLPLADFWRLGWQPGIDLRVVGARDHGQDFTLWPLKDGRWRWAPMRVEVG
jgi:hypothetical protein